jgi:hypothetical protein
VVKSKDTESRKPDTGAFKVNVPVAISLGPTEEYLPLKQVAKFPEVSLVRTSYVICKSDFQFDCKVGPAMSVYTVGNN